jgi:hypothetical protein
MTKGHVTVVATAKQLERAEEKFSQMKCVALGLFFEYAARASRGGTPSLEQHFKEASKGAYAVGELVTYRTGPQVEGLLLNKVIRSVKENLKNLKEEEGQGYAMAMIAKAHQVMRSPDKAIAVYSAI